MSQGQRSPQVVLIAMGIALGLWACPTMPRSPAENFDVTFGPDVTTDILLDGADIFVPLSLDRVRAAAGQPEGGERVTVHGTGFTPGAKVFFDDVPATGALALDDREINCDVPAHAPALVDVRVELLDGQQATLERAYLYRGPLLLTSIAPTDGPLRGGTEVTVVGDGFDTSTRVLVGGRLLQDAQVVDAQTIVGTAPSRLAGRGGLVEVIVSNGFEQRLLDRAYRYAEPLSLGWLEPAWGPSSGGTLVTLFGTGLEPDTVVRVGGTVAETVTAGNGETLTLRTPPGSHGPTDFELQHSFGSITVPRVFLTMDESLVPPGVWIGNGWPTMGPTQGGTPVALTVFGLEALDESQGIEVRFDSVPAQVVSIDPGLARVVVIAPAGSPGSADVMLVASGGGSVRDDIYVYEDTLAITTISPSLGLTAGGESVAIVGSGFTDHTVIHIGGREATVIERMDESTLLIETPVGVPGLVDVEATDGDRHVLIHAGFHVSSGGAATLLGVAPADGARAGGRLMRLYGSGLLGFADEIRFGDVPRSDVTVVDDGTLHVRSPRADVGQMSVDMGDAGLLAMVYEAFDPTLGYGGTHGGPIPEALNVTVIDVVSRTRLEGAFVILWDDLDTPYQAITDDRGQVTFSDEGFGAAQMVTAGKDMYTTASIVDFDGRNVTLMLIPLTSAPPSPGPGPPGPEPLPNGQLEGTVSGYEKYVLPPPGQCDSKLAAGTIAEGSALCQPCVSDEDCPGASSQCTPLGEQGSRCTIACEQPEDCPGGFSCVGVGFGAIQCIPSPGQRTAWCGTTKSSVFAPSVPEATGFTNGATEFSIDIPPGEYAIVCFGGYMDPDTGEFVPMMMGVRRHVFAMPGEALIDQDVHLDIPLTRTMRIRLDDPPMGPGQARNHQVDVFLDLGGDGVFPMLQRGVGVDQELFELPNFPVAFEESLYDASYIIYGAAYTDETLAGTSNDATFTLHKDITALHDDAVFRIQPQGAQVSATGIKSDIHAMASPPGGWVWAVGQRGRIMVWDGTWWSIQQAPTSEDLHGVWIRSASDGYAAGDGGTVLHWDGLVWTHVEVPETLAGAHWWGMTGDLGRVWLAGDMGVWSFDGVDWTPVHPGEGVPLGSIRALWTDGFGALWMVGDGGRIRRIADTGTEVHDVDGPNLLAVSGAHDQDVWAVGEDGRTIHWDGIVWFDYLPVTTRDLRAVHTLDQASVWAVGDAGIVLRWDGATWAEHATAPHVDLRGVRRSGDGTVLAGGRHVVIVGPFLALPRPVNPTSIGDLLDLDLTWAIDQGPDADFTYLQLTEENGFPFWSVMVRGGRHSAPLPDLMAAWGLPAIWSGPGWLRTLRVYMPGFTLDGYDNSQLSQSLWTSWATSDFPVLWP